MNVYIQLMQEASPPGKTAKTVLLACGAAFKDVCGVTTAYVL